METATDPVAVARVAYHRFQERLLAESPLGGIAEWIKSGLAPTAQELRAAGFRADVARENKGLIASAFHRTWGFSIPCAEAVQALCAISPLVEIGAGTGYWTALLRAAGADILATDLVDEGSPGYGLTVGVHSRVLALDAAAAVKAHPDRAVFCSWPTRDSEWCTDAASQISRGGLFALIARERGGTTASDSLYDLLENKFSLIQRIITPQFPEQDDSLKIYERC